MFQKSLIKCSLILVCSAVLLASCSHSDSSPTTQPDESVHQETRIEIPQEKIDNEREETIGGKKYRFIKYRDENDQLKDIILDEKGQKVDLADIEQPAASEPYGGTLKKLLEGEDTEQSDSRIECVVSLKDEVDIGEEPPNVSGDSENPGDSAVFEEQQREYQQKVTEAKIKKRRELLEKLLKDPVLKNLEPPMPEWEKNRYINLEVSFISLSIPVNEIKTFYDRNKDIISGIDVKPRVDSDSLRTAMKATGVLDVVNNKRKYQRYLGGNVGVYMTEPECSDYISSGDGYSSPNQYGYQTLGEVSCRALHPLNVASIIREVSPNSYIYCRNGAQLPTVSDLIRRDTPNIFVVSASFRFVVTDTGYTIFDREWDDFIYNKSILSVVAAGNEGLFDTYVTPPSRGLNVLTVGNYDDRVNSINPSSSWRDPSDTRNFKPEVSAPGTDIDAGYFYKGEGLQKIHMTGTSQATPHVSGIVANLTSAMPYLRNRPYLQKAYVIASALDSVSGGDDKTGKGGVDIKNIVNNIVYSWWMDGSNSYFDSYARNDIKPDSNVDLYFNVDSIKKTRVVLSWLNRGSWTYAHRKDLNPIGMDLDLTVYDPNGRYVGSSRSWKDGFEVVDFTPSQKGRYRISINRFANRDKASRLRMGIVVSTRD